MAKSSLFDNLKGHKSKAGERLVARVEKTLNESKADLQAAEVANQGVKSGRDIYIDPAVVRPDPKQPRRHFNEAALQELADTIDSNSQLQPVLVLPIDNNPKHQYQLVAGERRWRAISTLCRKTKKLWAVPVDLKSRKMILEAQIIENDAREDTLVMEKAIAYAQLVEQYKQEGVKGPAERVREKLKISKANMSKYRALADQSEVLLPLNIQYPTEGFVGLYMLASLLKTDSVSAKKHIKDFKTQKGKKSLRALLESIEQAPATTPKSKVVTSGTEKDDGNDERALTDGNSKEKPGKAKVEPKPRRVDDIEFSVNGDQVHLTLFLKSGKQLFVTDIGVMEKLAEELNQEAIA
ncbi:ParB/RepB/Spo0J family partition protein [uncultured Microbulbifer sp.]|uniref:ParB/RepB/Spo0J family partition protein n=1 Tax=uncultured Microbulbifer sp. TaxID=348147 RepID=UPI0026342FFF|nr:ParB/RepB/Spo0J family partition protein [uncultured Microbulbifer sp.]